MVYGGKYLALLAELHLGLGGVDVHIHSGQPQLQMEDTAWKFAHHLLVLIGLLQGGGHQRAFHLAAVDEKELPAPAAPAAGGHGHEAGHSHILAAGLHRAEAQCQLPAQDGIDGGLELSVTGGKQLLLAVPDKFHTHLRVGQGRPLDHGKDGRPLGGVLFHEFQPGGGVVEQVPHHHGGAQGAARLLHLSRYSALQGQGGPQRGVRCPGHHLHTGHGGDGGQSLPPETQGADGLQVILSAQLAGGVAEEGGFQLPGGDALPVVRHPEEGHSSVGDLHRDGGGPSVDGVLHQLLGHAGGPLYDFTGGDQVGNMGV
ncbi:Uncharacterised protein [uncultured Clostridium sp.]|nr:Uncharacterised protein [uncultured Clostridium sp.]